MSSNSVKSDTRRSGSTRFAVVAAADAGAAAADDDAAVRSWRSSSVGSLRSVVESSRARTRCARGASRSAARASVPLPSSSAATGSRQRPAAASATASAEHGAQVLHRPTASGLDRFSRSVVAAAARRARRRGRRRRGARTARPSAPGRSSPVPETSSAQASPRSGRTASSQAVDGRRASPRGARGWRGSCLGGAAGRPSSPQRGERTVLRDQVRVQPRQRGLELQAAAHQRARAGEEADPRAGHARSSARPRTWPPRARSAPSGGRAARRAGSIASGPWVTSWTSSSPWRSASAASASQLVERGRRPVRVRPGRPRRSRACAA